MASNPDFVQFIIDQCSGAGEIAVKKMMGDYCAYCDGVLFGLISRQLLLCEGDGVWQDYPEGSHFAAAI